MAVVLERKGSDLYVGLRADRLPRSVWGSNLRSFLPRKDWRGLSQTTSERVHGECEACGAEPKTIKQTKDSGLDCNEMWEFDEHDGHVQRLVGVIALCEWCHLTQHSGRAEMTGRFEDVIEVLVAVNHWTRKRAMRDVDESVRRFQHFSEFEWDLDLSILQGWMTLAGYDRLLVPADERWKLGNTYTKTRPTVSPSFGGPPPSLMWAWGGSVDIVDI